MPGRLTFGSSPWAESGDMMSKKLLPFLIALVFAFAGCLGIADDESEPAGEGPTGSDEHDNHSGNESDENEGDDGNGSENEDTNETASEPPTASLEANVTSGAAPLNVTFTLDGSGSGDDELSWSLDLGDESDLQEASGLPATVEHTYREMGNFTVVLEVFNEEHSTSTNVTITVDAPASPQPVLVLEGATELPGSPAATSPLNALGCVGFLAGMNELDCVFFELEEEHAGLDYALETDAGAPFHAFMTGCDPTADEIDVHDGDVEGGGVPEQAGCVAMWNYGLGTATFTFTLYEA